MHAVHHWGIGFFFSFFLFFFFFLIQAVFMYGDAVSSNTETLSYTSTSLEKKCPNAKMRHLVGNGELNFKMFTLNYGKVISFTMFCCMCKTFLFCFVLFFSEKSAGSLQSKNCVWQWRVGLQLDWILQLQSKIVMEENSLVLVHGFITIK